MWTSALSGAVSALAYEQQRRDMQPWREEGLRNLTGMYEAHIGQQRLRSYTCRACGAPAEGEACSYCLTRG